MLRVEIDGDAHLEELAFDEMSEIWITENLIPTKDLGLIHMTMKNGLKNVWKKHLNLWRS